MPPYRFDFNVIWANYGVLLIGLAHTLEFTVVCILLGSAWGFLLALIRRSSFRPASILSATYVEFFRGTPVFVQLFWIFFCLPLILRVDLSNLACSIIALTLYMGAIASESFRAALNAIPKEQLDASHALGLPAYQRIRYVILPQALLLSIPNLLSNGISLFKESALVSAVGMVDLMYLARSLSNVTARPLEILTAAAVTYFIVAFPVTRLVTWLERRIRGRMAG